MREVLKTLNECPGVLGSLVTTTDGMLVCSELRQGPDEETAAALVSSLVSGTSSLLAEFGRARLQQLVLRASRGKIIISDLENAYLVTVTGASIDLDQGLLEIRSAAQTLKRLGQISV